MPCLPEVCHFLCHRKAHKYIYEVTRDVVCACMESQMQIRVWDHYTIKVSRREFLVSEMCVTLVPF
jgi:hypothetical protein